MSEVRLGDVIDDHCIKCRRVTNHAVVSIVDEKPAKVRCRTCYHDHDFRHEQAPPSKKDLKKLELFNQVLASVNPGAVEPGLDGEIEQEIELEPEAESEPESVPVPVATAEAPAKKTKARTKKA